MDLREGRQIVPAAAASVLCKAEHLHCTEVKALFAQYIAGIDYPLTSGQIKVDQYGAAALGIGSNFRRDQEPFAVVWMDDPQLLNVDQKLGGGEGAHFLAGILQFLAVNFWSKGMLWP